MTGPWARENVTDQVSIGLNFTSDWLSEKVTRVSFGRSQYTMLSALLQTWRIFGTECKKVSLLFRTVSCRRRRMGAAVRAGAAEETCEAQIRGTTTAKGRAIGWTAPSAGRRIWNGRQSKKIDGWKQSKVCLMLLSVTASHETMSIEFRLSGG